MSSFFATLRARFGRFEDGSVIKQISREEFVYQKPDGHSVVVYVFRVSEPGGEVDRVLQMSSIVKWSQPDKSERISELDQRDIVLKFERHFRAYREVMQAE